MKTIRLLLIFILGLNYSYSQKPIDSTVSNLNNYRWRIDVGFGESRGIRPFTDGYYSSNSQTILGTTNINSITVGATYSYSRLVAFKLDLGFDRFINKDDKSKPFEVAQYKTTFQAILDINDLLKYQNENSRLKLLFHAGFSLSTLQKIRSNISPVVGSKELNGGVVFGFTPMFRITKKAYVYLDFSSFHNYRQHYTWDGSYSKPSNNLSGQMINGSLGLTYSIGKLHKWEIDNKEIKKLEEKNEALEKRVGDLETMMNDTDKDGVADYLDSENNSVAGVAVDSRGVMVDINRNGVPDELERYFEKTYAKNDVKKQEIEISGDSKKVSQFTSKEDFLKRSINEGYITVFFEINSAKPNTQSLDGISFILTFLKANPNDSIDIIGYSDEVGNDNKNQKLALARANNVKKVLVKSGIDATRLNVISAGEDTSVDISSKDARSIVRRVIFKIK
ncbi:OmpA family protein [Flavobacterium sp. SUN052]|uniref:OmpA family protein n=1 Tax=Flavobacterium sp. SUN052 TaxID=3002441 RepID=UPI00237E14D1|nr:OmpA family protein [Flavobacterium sp. SUN052]MEC4005482.1 OmpA family protein [Flavobacterium sp. SUN052]